MKLAILFTFSILVINISCKKNKPVNILSHLPPETQTGANTFGCLVNASVFKRGGASLIGGSLQSNYQFVNNSHYFILIGRNQTGSNLSTSVGLYTDSITFREGNRLVLSSRIKVNASANYFKALRAYQYEQCNTDGSTFKGELLIRKLDTVNQIVSGTFWFDAANDKGEKVEVRDDPFVVSYTS